DDTGGIARRTAGRDARVRVMDTTDLPAGWFGKQWACANGAAAATGEIFVFVDADARAAPDLVTRSVNGMQRTRADLYTVAGQQDMHTFWERLIQPQVFTVMATRYGGTESINRSRRASDKIANGQYLMLRRAAYEALGGHALVRSHVAEDLMLAQKFFAAGRTTVIILGLEQLATRMYTSLGELIAGWRKNIFAGGRDTVPLGRVGRALFPLVLPLPSLMQLVPVLVLIASVVVAIPAGVALWSAIATLATLAWWGAIYFGARQPLWLALCFPIGAALLLYIVLTATWRGSAVQWKGRSYRSGAPGRAA
ncbi:MAG TPA: glycosyltransferase, partial [Candidatus Elarobacter sp.]|nr:glycosyltransferase [Candidatus Elarobacter sp.]